MVGAQSVADLTTLLKKTRGHVPPALVGCSVTVLHDKVFVFGGRLPSTKQMTNHLYIMDLHSLEWQRHIGSPDSDRPPSPRYFHSATAYRHYIVYFGGMTTEHTSFRSNNSHISDGDTLTLNDVYLFDTIEHTWIKPRIPRSLFTPKPRYAHIALISTTEKDKLVIMGGQDANNEYVNEFNVLDLISFEWLLGSTLDRPCGIYRTVPFEQPIEERRYQYLDHHQSKHHPLPSLNTHSNNLFFYANYNFTANTMTRELFSFDPTRPISQGNGILDHSQLVQTDTKKIFPPGLRFPHGEVIGQHLIVAGTHLGIHSRSYQVWALHLGTFTWSRIDTGSRLVVGSWNRGMHYNNQWILFGNRQRDIFTDYKQRQINFDHMAIIQLEAFGIYTTPLPTCNQLGRELGLTMLNEPNMADVYILTNDHQVIPANSSILSLRWPYAAKLFRRRLYNNNDGDTNQSVIQGGRQRHERGIGKTLLFSETYSVTLSFLQYIYTDHLMTVQQYQPSVLARLLILADIYQMSRLKELTTHALHQILTISTASLIYESTTLTNQLGLQIRALRVMLNAKKQLEKQQQQILSVPSSAPPSTPPPPTPTSPDQRSLTSQTFLYDHHHDYFFSGSPVSPTSPQQPLLYLAAHPTMNSSGSTMHLARKKSSPRSFSSGSSSISSHDDPHAPSPYNHPPSTIINNQPASTYSNSKDGSTGKFNWRKIQQSTIALAKPRPLRVDASHLQPFYDL